MAIVVQVPSAQGSLEKNEGCELAPAQILGQLSGLRPATEIVKIIPSNLEETQHNIRAAAGKLFAQGEKPLFLGGDHSITLPIYQAFAETYPNSGMVLVDAHADCYQYLAPGSHEDYMHILVKDGILNPENILMLGTRHIWEEEEKFIAEQKIKVFGPLEIREGKALEELVSFPKKVDHIYLSIDIDALDAAVAPGTGYPEKDGLQLSEVAEIVELLKESGKVFGADLVEVNPLLEGGKATVAAGAHIVKQLLRLL